MTEYLNRGGEAYRYRCPKGHTSIEKRTNKLEPETSRMLAGPSWSKPLDGPTPQGKYYCTACQENFNELEDAKTGKIVQP